MQDPVENPNNDLRDQIKAGEYMPAANAGGITPTDQLDWSLGLHVSASNAIRVLTINDEGDAEEKGLIEALFELSEGSEVEDAKQEGKIALDIVKGDNTLSSRIDALECSYEGQSISPANYPVAPEVTTPANANYAFAAAEAANGERKVFKGEPIRGHWDVYLNGVYEATISGDTPKYKFEAAPALGSTVEFAGVGFNVNHFIIDLEDMEKSILDLTVEATTTKDDFVVEATQMTEEFKSEKAEAEKNRDEQNAMLAEEKKAAKEAQEDMEGATTVAEVEEARDAAEKSYTEVRTIQGAVRNAECSIAGYDADLAAIAKAKEANEAEYVQSIESLKSAADKAADTIAKFKQILKEHEDFGSDAEA